MLHLNPMTGRSEWKMHAEDYDYQQEVARAAFADMLHDRERVSGLAKSSYLSIQSNRSQIINGVEALYFSAEPSLLRRPPLGHSRVACSRRPGPQMFKDQKIWFNLLTKKGLYHFGCCRKCKRGTDPKSGKIRF